MTGGTHPSARAAGGPAFVLGRDIRGADFIRAVEGACGVVLPLLSKLRLSSSYL
uniref:Putative retrotransposon protein n=1 Tax=Oryza sativa subsp. indica TaxID=39946 RepID=C5NNR4_ORYSI|nr:putative retrotransposon protein [Oryza sativa Indica Group]